MSDTRNPIERLGAVCTETEEALAELARLARREHDLRHDIRLTRIHVDDILNSRTWRALELYRKARIRAGLSGVNPAAIRAAVRRRWINRPLPRAVRDLPAGINVAGYLDAESGMGEAARASIRSIEAAGLPVALNNVPSLLRTRDASYRSAFVDTNPHPFNLIHLNGDNMPAFAAARGRRYFRDHYTIGYWFWELSTLRPDWAPFAGYVDEVWTATRFVRDAVSAACTVPTVRMPLPIVLPPIPSLGRAHFNLPEEPRVFLYIFDVSSQTERKNPLAAIRAFRRAGLPHDDAVLVLKFTNPEYRSGRGSPPPRGVGRAQRRLSRCLPRPAGALRARQYRGLLSVASPRRRIRPDAARGHASGQAGDRDRLFRQHGFHDGREQLPARLLARHLDT